MVNASIMCFQNGESFLMTWPDSTFDLAFLDIEMNNMTGIELSEMIRRTDNHMQIVFITSHKQYALTGYDVNALHYLIKPASPAKILPILDKAYIMWKATKDMFILVPDSAGQRKLSLGKVLYISVQSHTAKLHTRDTIYEMRKSLNEFIDELPDNFIKIHRSYIVNIYEAECVYKDSILLSNAEKLPISRKNAKDVNDTFIRLHTVR